MGDIPEQFNAAEYFIDRHIAEGRGRKVAIECGRERVCYDELHSNVNRAGNAFRSIGLHIEERIALVLNDTPEFAFSFFGAVKIGAVPVPLSTFLKPSDYEFMLNDCRARAIVISPELLPCLEEIRERLPYLSAVVVAGKQADRPYLNFGDLTAAQSTCLTPQRTTRDDPAFWLYSSGSTGQPKGCVHLQHDMSVAAEQYAKRTLGATEDDRFFSASKLFFAYGLGNGLYFPLALGATSILWPGSAHPANVLGVIKEHRPTLLFSVPSNYSAILQHAASVPKSELSSVRFAVSAGEPLPAVIFQRFKDRFGIEILDGIGSTEATHIFISNRPGAIRPGSTGQPVVGVEVRILDDQDRPVPQGEIGNLWAKSDAICERYWNRHELSKNTIQGEWISTGDKYWQDKDGFFWYAGRRDDMLKVSGVWVSPVEIEGVLAEHPDVAESAVIAAADADTLLKPHAYVVLREGREPSAELAQALQDWVEQKLARYKRPRAIHFVASLPKTGTGKIQRFALRDRSREGSSEPDTHSF